jgi:hypothetical protein
MGLGTAGLGLGPGVGDTRGWGDGKGVGGSLLPLNQPADQATPSPTALLTTALIYSGSVRLDSRQVSVGSVSVFASPSVLQYFCTSHLQHHLASPHWKPQLCAPA